MYKSEARQNDISMPALGGRAGADGEACAARNAAKISVNNMSLYRAVINQYHENRWTDLKSPQLEDKRAQMVRESCKCAALAARDAEGLFAPHASKVPTTASERRGNNLKVSRTFS